MIDVHAMAINQIWRCFYPFCVCIPLHTHTDLSDGHRALSFFALAEWSSYSRLPLATLNRFSISKIRYLVVHSWLSTHSWLLKGHFFVEIVVKDSRHAVSSTGREKTILQVTYSLINLCLLVILLFSKTGRVVNQWSCVVDWTCFIPSIEHLYHIVLKLFCFLRFY